MSTAEKADLGPGRALAAVYVIFALAAGARSAVQIATDFESAPVAYLLSGAAAILYLVAALALARPGDRALRVGLAACTIELTGVLIVGTVSLADPGVFPDETVWSGYGNGYGFIPLVLPIAGLAWLRYRSQPATVTEISVT